MSKTKKIATAVVSIVLASSLCMGIAACGSDDDEDTSVDFSYADYIDIYNTDVSSVNLHLAIGHNKNTLSTSYQLLGDVGVTMADGVSYSQGDFKPAWNQMKTELGVSFTDVYSGKDTGSNLSNALTVSGDSAWSNTDIITTDLSKVTESASNGTSFLNLGKYLNSMPNFKAYLEANPVVEYSIVSGYDSETGYKTIYVSPYFDGNDDVERYCICRQDWVTALLDNTSSLGDGETWANASASSGAVSCNSYMGQTGYVSVEITDTSNHAKTKTIYKNYANALNEVKTSGTALNTAYTAITSDVAYSGASGNIVDIMNAALTVNSSATCKQLSTLFSAYIKACYTTDTATSNATSYYTNASALFNGADAAWDVDDLVAMLRCVITSGTNLTTGTVVGLFTRSYQNDRTPDLIRLVGQLYGVRGVDSRYEYTYLDANGDIQDARNDEDLWEALAEMNNLWNEGLIYQSNYNSSNSGSGSSALTGLGTIDGFMMYDFVQTQTLNGFYVENSTISSSNYSSLGSSYYFAPVLNPVSKWSVNGDDDTIMRFTESWRSTKTSGIAINGSVENDSAKLAACLKFVDYLFSNDGMILMTYGPQATDAGDGNTASGGFFYDPEVTDLTSIKSGATSIADLASVNGVSYEESSGQYSIDKTSSLASSYYIYKNKVYTGTYYKGYTAPTLTSAMLNSFKGTSSVGAAIAGNTNIQGSILNFTNYARLIIGSTLPVAVKDQCFEYQLTSEMGKAGADNVGDALVNGVVKGMTVSLDTATYGSNAYWYMVVPTGLPFTSLESNSMTTSGQMTLQYVTGTQKDDKNFYSVYHYVIMNGLNGGQYYQQGVYFTVGTSASDMVSKMVSQGSETRETLIRQAWDRLKGWYAGI